VGFFWWVWLAIALGISWTHKRLRDWNRRIAADPATLAARAKARDALVAALAPALAARQAAAQPAAAAPARSAAVPAYAAQTAYAAQPGYAAPPPAAQAQPGSSARKLHREPAAAQRTVTPVARSVDVPTTATAATAGTWMLKGALDDPAHARAAIVIAEVLGPPVGLR
jgi:hypothetical protein